MWRGRPTIYRPESRSYYFLPSIQLPEPITAIRNEPAILNNPIEYLRGVGPQRGELLKKELGIFTFRDLLFHFPFRHLDKSQVHSIREISGDADYIQVSGVIKTLEMTGEKKYGKRLTAVLQDESGVIDLVWFQGGAWIQKTLHLNGKYLVYGKTSYFNGRWQIAHPEMEPVTPQNREGKNYLDPIYPSSEKLKVRGLGGRAIGKLTRTLLDQLGPGDIPENLPADILEQFRLVSRFTAISDMHFPGTEQDHYQGERRLKFEELFFAQLSIGRLKIHRQQVSVGVIFEKVGDLFNRFYHGSLPFALTGAQKKVIREIRKDTLTGHQMNRLLQGDVGSGKTIVALLAMLLAIDNGFQACLMAPTGILAQQHLQNISGLLKDLSVKPVLLTGGIKGKARQKILEDLGSGQTSLIIGTHALIEEQVRFASLGLAIVDEQHRFGVAQRAKLWAKQAIPPHILVMTATPIPRTLAMTAYGDLDVSVIDELPPGRQPIRTLHRFERYRSQVMEFIKGEVHQGHQAYIVYPLIEESEKLDYENLMKGYEEVKAYFPDPEYLVSMVHGRQPADQRRTNMDRFVRGQTQIMVATTVIEVGVDIPNASVMLIESAERFGLSQLHQLRGRVGRGANHCWCILMTRDRAGREITERIRIMLQTTDGFAIAEKDLELRGPGDIEGTRQSGVMEFRVADIVRDKPILEAAREAASRILATDPQLLYPEHSRLSAHLKSQGSGSPWGKIS